MRPRLFYRLAVPVVAFGVAGNLLLCLVVFKRLKSPVSYNIKVIESAPVPEMPTALSLTVPGEISPTSNNVGMVATPVMVNPTPPRAYSLVYHYMECDNNPIAWCNGRYLHIGDRHAYGVVVDIFPERIYLSNGDYIDNVKTKGTYGNETSGGAAGL